MDKQYCILRVGKKYKTLGQIEGFRKHMEREIETLNSNGARNLLLVGNYDLNFVEYTLARLKQRKGAVLAREMLLTASPSFFKGLTDDELEKWTYANRDFLDLNFRTVVYANLHLDENCPHIHVLLVPVYDNDKLSNSYYFDGIAKMRAWQDKYFEHMNKIFPQLQRGMEYSKATHTDIQKFYSLINKDFNEMDLDQLKARAKYSELLEIKIQAKDRTLEAYKKQNEKLREDNNNIGLELTKINSKASLLDKTIKYMAKVYKVTEKRLNEIMDYIDGKDRGRER